MSFTLTVRNTDISIQNDRTVRYAAPGWYAKEIFQQLGKWQRVHQCLRTLYFSHLSSRGDRAFEQKCGQTPENGVCNVWQLFQKFAHPALVLGSQFEIPGFLSWPDLVAEFGSFVRNLRSVSQDTCLKTDDWRKDDSQIRAIGPTFHYVTELRNAARGTQFND